METIVLGTYMVCAILFILSLGGLSNQQTAKSGNLYGVFAMILAIIATFFQPDFDYHFELWGPAFFVGGLIGFVIALKVEMISMPQLVAALHSFVGLAATMVGFAFFLLNHQQEALPVIETSVGIFIGAVTFTGSVVAWGKLQGTIRSTPLIILGQGRHLINLVCILGCVALSILFGLSEDTLEQFYYLLGNAFLAGFLGWHLVMAIGGADMPVVVSMLNSYSGWATSASGFLLENQLLIVTGALVGSSGAILSYIMCRAMNRSFFNVIGGGFGIPTAGSTGPKATGEPKTIDIKQMDNLLMNARNIVIVPGYGMAVARCQHDVGTLAKLLTKVGRKVNFCIHPVAGRLPGHMNVLLAEADVDYSIVKEMDEINEHFQEVDLVMIIGANDIVNPDAEEDPNSPIAGMPVCQVWKSRNVVVFKRGGGTGYSGIENPLFVKPNTRMYYGSADKSIKEILNAVTENIKGYEQSSGVPQIKEVSTSDEKEENIPDPCKTIGIPKEVFPGEKRVAMTPQTVKKFRKFGFQVWVQEGAGRGANFSDQAYIQAGAFIKSTEQVWKADIVAKVRPPTQHPNLGVHQDSLLGNTQCLISYVFPSTCQDWLHELSQKYPNLTYLAIDSVPRITRAQKLDSLSSMANIGGYRAVMEGFQYFKKCPKPMITAAGKLPPAQVLIIGAGVAGLSAIGYCKNLGCIVKAIDTRPAARQDAESMGAQFLTVQVQEEGTGVGGYAKLMSEEYQRAQYQLTKETARKADIIITTALIPGRPAPKLIDQGIVEEMKPGSVIVDMAAEMGGNCSLTVGGEVFQTENGVSIVGFTDLVSRMAPQSSELYSNNIWHLLDDMGRAEDFKVNLEDEIIKAMTVVHQGKMTWTPPQPAAAPPQPKSGNSPVLPSAEKPSQFRKIDWLVVSLLMVGVFVGLSAATYTSFMNLFLIFILAVFIGYMVIWNVSPALHTPLMSVTNAISGIIIVGAMMTLDADSGWIDEGSAVGWIAVFLASINIWGGFVVTQRMLNMFKTEKSN